MFKTISSYVAILITIVLITACGFHLRGVVDIPFKTIYVKDNKTPITQDVIRALKSNGVEVTKEIEKAEVAFEIMSDSNVKRILSLGGGGAAAGAVREFELLHVLTFRMRSGKSESWSKTQTIENRRDFSFDDKEILAKTYEEAMLYDAMRQDAVRELIRRIVVFNPNESADEEEVLTP
jgi:LPS-assembly lipoprotein